MKSTKQKILEAASELFAKGGLQALSVRTIATQAGLSTIGIYSHFKGKQGILDALYIEGFEKVLEALDVTDHNSDPRQAVLQASRNYLATAEQFGAHYQLIFGRNSDGYTPSPAAREVGANAFKALTDVVGLLLAQTATDQDKQYAALNIWSFIHGSVSLSDHDVAHIIDMNGWKERTLEGVKTLMNSMQDN